MGTHVVFGNILWVESRDKFLNFNLWMTLRQLLSNAEFNVWNMPIHHCFRNYVVSCKFLAVFFAMEYFSWL